MDSLVQALRYAARRDGRPPSPSPPWRRSPSARVDPSVALRAE